MPVWSKTRRGELGLGRGKSQTEADENALKKLKETAATENEKIVYRYFSYGADSGVPPPTNRDAKRLGCHEASLRSH
jgi:hypothetical protein